MKKVDRVVKRACMLILSAIAGVSINGCGGGGGTATNNNNSAMYGVPNIVVSGKVTQRNGLPIKGIQIEEQRKDSSYTKSVCTAVDGTYSISDFPSYPIKIIVTDVDGSDNGGEFDTQTIDIYSSDAKQSDWEFEKQLDIVLEPKNDSAQ